MVWNNAPVHFYASFIKDTICANATGVKLRHDLHLQLSGLWKSPEFWIFDEQYSQIKSNTAFSLPINLHCKSLAAWFYIPYRRYVWGCCRTLWWFNSISAIRFHKSTSKSLALSMFAQCFKVAFLDVFAYL